MQTIRSRADADAAAALVEKELAFAVATVESDALANRVQLKLL